MAFETSTHRLILFAALMCACSSNSGTNLHAEKLSWKRWGTCARGIDSKDSCICAGNFIYLDEKRCSFVAQKECSVENNACVETCSQNLIRSEYGNCVNICSQPFTWTDKQNQNHCGPACPKNYRAEGYRCLACADECAECRTNGTTLDDCKRKCSYARYYNYCVLTCPNNTLRFEKNICISSLKCVHFVHNNDCLLQCPPGTYISNSSDIPQKCLSCSEQCLGGCSGAETDQCDRDGCRTLRHGDHCVEECPPEAPWGYQGSCYLSCPGYIDHTTCVDRCPAKTFSLNNYCISQCPQEAQFVNINECVHRCPKLVYQFQCVSSCPRNNLVALTECVDACPDIYPLKNSTHCLTDCGSNYQLQMANETICVNKCPTNYLIENRKCVNACSQANSYTNPMTRECEANCSYYLLQNECISSCPDPLLGDRVTKQCLSKCPEHPFLLYNKECLSTCPQAARYRYENTCVNNCSLASRGSRLLPYEYNNTCVRTCPENMLLDGYLCVLKCTAYGKFLVYNKTCVHWCPSNARYRFSHNNTCTSTCGELLHRSHQYRTLWSCVDSCYDEEVVDPLTNTCLSKCPPNLPYLLNSTCVQKCPSGTLHSDYTVRGNGKTHKHCVTMCRPGDKQVKHTRTCSSVCPTPTPIASNGTCVKRCPSDTVTATWTVGTRTEAECVYKCPKNAPYSDASGCTDCCPSRSVDYKCTDSCPGTTLFETPATYKHCNGTICVQSCPEGEITLEKRCVDRKHCKRPMGIDHLGRCVENCSNKDNTHPPQESDIQFRCYRHVEYKENLPVVVGCIVSALFGSGLLIHLFPIYQFKNRKYKKKIASIRVEITRGSNQTVETATVTMQESTAGHEAQNSRSSQANLPSRDFAAEQLTEGSSQITREENTSQSTSAPRRTSAEEDVEVARQEMFNLKAKSFWEEYTYGERAPLDETTHL